MRSLNIKDPEAHRLASAIARETGETMTQVVTGMRLLARPMLGKSLNRPQAS